MTGEITPLAAQKIVRKIILRVLPLSFMLYIVAFLDRVNLGYAALQMNRDLALSSEAFGFAAGVFFIGNVLFEIPSNVLLLRYGPRKWIARIIFTWGVVATLTAFVHTATELYVLRFLLGVAEAGFIPGMVFYFSLWFREKERASAIGLFLIAMPVTYLFAAPVSTAIMHYVHFWGIAGWRCMLFLEGLPALIGAVLCFFFLTDSPEHARWLTAQEKAWLASEFERERMQTPNVQNLNARQALANPVILFMALIYFLSQLGALGIGYWLPQIVRGFSSTLSLTQIGLISGLPYAVTAVGLVTWSRLSDHFGERKLFAAVPLALGAVGLFIAGTTHDPYVAIFAITVALVGIYATKPPFFAMLNQIVTRPTVAIASAVITSIGNVGGFAGPYLLGVTGRIGGPRTGGLLVLSVALLLAAFLILLIRLGKVREPFIGPGSMGDASRLGK